MGFIYVLEFGGQHSDLIGKRLEEIGFPVKYAKSRVRLDEIPDASGIVLSGSPSSVDEAYAPKYDMRMFDPSYNNVPVLGICYGMQLIAYTHGSALHKRTREYGETMVYLDGRNELFDGVEPVDTVWMNHGDSVVSGDFTTLAYSEKGVPAAIHSNRGPYWGVQFHPEVTHTNPGRLIIGNFAEKICGLQSSGQKGFDADKFIEGAIQRLKDEVGNDIGLAYVSGGVDSTVVAALAKEAGIKIKPVHIETGGGRKGEAQYAQSRISNLLGTDVYVLDRSHRFVSGLAGIDDSEAKRKAFRNMYDDTKREIEREFDISDTVLLDGTLATDKRESGEEAGTGNGEDTGTVANVKTHHNTGTWEGRKSCPLDELTKERVRSVARRLCLPKEISERQPFPGPGLFVRFSTAYYEVPEALMRDAISIADSYDMEAFVLPRKSVGLKGDSRALEYAAILTGERDWSRIRKGSKRMIEDLPICRTLYSPAHVDYTGADFNRAENFQMTGENLDRLREVTDLVERTMDEYGVRSSQTPVITFGGPRGWINVIRDVNSKDFRTLRPLKKPEEFPWECYDEIDRRLRERLGEDAGMTTFDVSDKPGGTTEWE